MKAHKKILLPALLSLSLLLCGCSQVAAADTENSTDSADEINILQQSESEDTSSLNLTDDADDQTDGEAQTQEEYRLGQLQPYIEELEKINEKFDVDLVMRLSDPEEIDGAYNEFCSMSTEEFRDEIIGRIHGNIAFICDGDGNLIPMPHYIDVDQKEYKLAQLQPYIDELEKINEELGINLAVSWSGPESIAWAYKEYCSMSLEEYRDYIIKLCNGEITVSYDEDGNKIIHYFDESDDIQD